MFAVVALIVPASTVPVTLKFVRPVRFVMFAFVMLAFVAVRLVTFARLLILFWALECDWNCRCKYDQCNNSKHQQPGWSD